MTHHLHAHTSSVRTADEDTEGMTSVLLQACRGMISKLVLIACSASGKDFRQRKILRWCQVCKPPPHCASLVNVSVFLYNFAASFPPAAWSCVLLAADVANGEVFRLFRAPDDEAILTTGFGVALSLGVCGSGLSGGRTAVVGGSRPREDVSGRWKS